VRKLANSFVFEFHEAIANLAGSTPARKLVIAIEMFNFSIGGKVLCCNMTVLTESRGQDERLINLDRPVSR